MTEYREKTYTYEDQPDKFGSVDGAIDRALQRSKEEQGPSEAKAHIKNVRDATVNKGERGANGPSDGPDKDTLKIIGGVVAVVAAIALGVTIKKKSSNNKKEEVEEEAHGFFDKAGSKLGFIGNKAEHGADKAGNKANEAGNKISGAASSAKDKASEIIPQPISDAASSIKESLNVTGIKAEREGLKASEKSDHAVRDAADKLIHTSDKASNKAEQKTGGFFSGISNLFNKDRK